MRRCAAAWLVLLGSLAAGCGQFGQVNEGRVVAYDRERGQVTVILDSNPKGPGAPRYDQLPPVVVRVPVDRKEMGLEPQVGDIVRYYYKDPSQALRMMNVTRTDLNKSGK